MKTVETHFVVEKGNFQETVNAIIIVLRKLYNEEDFVRCLVTIDTRRVDFELCGKHTPKKNIKKKDINDFPIKEYVS